jgi:hypothetical protein
VTLGGATALASGGHATGGASSNSGGFAVTGTGASGAMATGGSESVASSGASSSAGATNSPDHMAQLRAEPSWKDLKTLWKNLDAVAPTSSTYIPYAQTITTEQRDRWIAELGAKLGELEASALLSSLELLFLREVATARIEVMRDGGYHYEMYLHRSPYLFERATESSIGRLEQKLDVLESLRGSCQIEPDAYRQALEQVEREATVFFVMDQLMQEPFSGYPSIALPTDLWGEELVSELDKRLAGFAADPATNDTQKAEVVALRGRLDTIGSTVIKLPVLLQELERCE